MCGVWVEIHIPSQNSSRFSIYYTRQAEGIAEGAHACVCKGKSCGVKNYSSPSSSSSFSKRRRLATGSGFRSPRDSTFFFASSYSFSEIALGRWERREGLRICPKCRASSDSRSKRASSSSRFL